MSLPHAAIIAALIGSVVAPRALGDVIAQWNFNSGVIVEDTYETLTSPNSLPGRITMIGGTSGGFNDGNAYGGSSDPTVTGDFALGLSSFPRATENSGQAGICVEVSTAGWSEIVISWDQRNSPTASRFGILEYTSNFSLQDPQWLLAGSFSTTESSRWTRQANVVDPASYALGFSLAGLSEVNNNENFAFRIVSIFEPNSNAYAPTNGSSYGANGTWRFDMLTISGTRMPPTEGEPVPDSTAGVLPLALATLGVVGWLRRRSSRRG